MSTICNCHWKITLGMIGTQTTRCEHQFYHRSRHGLMRYYSLTFRFFLNIMCFFLIDFRSLYFAWLQWNTRLIHLLIWSTYLNNWILNSTITLYYCSWQQMEPEIHQVVFLMYDGIKQLILDTFQTLQWKRCLWQLLWIYQMTVLHLEGKTFNCMLFD